MDLIVFKYYLSPKKNVTKGRFKNYMYVVLWLSFFQFARLWEVKNVMFVCSWEHDQVSAYERCPLAEGWLYKHCNLFS